MNIWNTIEIIFSENVKNDYINIKVLYKRSKKKFYLEKLQWTLSPTTNYDFEGVHNGAEASDTFKQMATMSSDELEVSRSHLLKYCGLDTYALVKVWEKLREAVKCKDC